MSRSKSSSQKMGGPVCKAADVSRDHSRAFKGAAFLPPGGTLRNMAG